MKLLFFIKINWRDCIIVKIFQNQASKCLKYKIFVKIEKIEIKILNSFF